MTAPQLRLPGLGGEAGRWFRVIQDWADALVRDTAREIASVVARLDILETPKFRTFNVDLVSGVATVSDPLIVDGSRVVVSRHTQAGTISSTVEYDVATLTPGVGFTVRARTSTGATATGDGSELYAIVVDP